MASFIDFAQSTTPVVPDTGRVRLFLNTSDDLCIIKDDGTVINIDNYFDKFIELTDTPTSWGTSGQVPIVNGTTDGLVFLTPGDGFTANFGLGTNDIARGDHNHDDRYYTETELDAGQLNNLYFTQTQLLAGSLNTLYYTQTALLNGSLDVRYYTQTELLTNGVLDSRYYTETELQTSGSSSVHFDNITNIPSDITDLSIHSVTELNDISDAGSGLIITDLERTKLAGIQDGANNIVVTNTGSDCPGGFTTGESGYSFTNDIMCITSETHKNLTLTEYVFKFNINDDNLTHYSIIIDTGIPNSTLKKGKRFLAGFTIDDVVDNTEFLVGEIYNENPLKFKFKYMNGVVFPTHISGVLKIFGNIGQTETTYPL